MQAFDKSVISTDIENVGQGHSLQRFISQVLSNLFEPNFSRKMTFTGSVAFMYAGPNFFTMYSYLAVHHSSLLMLLLITQKIALVVSYETGQYWEEIKQEQLHDGCSIGRGKSDGYIRFN